MGCLQAEGAACGRELVFKGRHAAGKGSAGGMAAFVGRSESSTPIWQRPKGASPISASAVPVPAIPTAAVVAAVIFANARRVIVSLPMHPPFLWRAVSSCGSRPLVRAACRPSSRPRGVPAADFELPRTAPSRACARHVRRWLRYGGKRAARIRLVAWLRTEWRNHVSSMMALTWEDIG